MCHLQLVGTQKFLVGGGAGRHRHGRAAGDNDLSAGQHVCGDQAHAVGHRGQVRRVAQTCAGSQALADWKRLLEDGERRSGVSLCHVLRGLKRHRGGFLTDGSR